MELTAAEVAKHLGGEVIGDAKQVLRSITTAENAKSGDLVFAEHADYFARAEASQASAILVPANQSTSDKTLIRVPNVRVAFARALSLFFAEPVFSAGVHPTAEVAKSAVIDPTAHVGPFCVIGERVKIGPRAVLEGGDYIGDDCVLSEDARLFPRVVLYARTQIGQRVRIHAGVVIGADGFGYAFDQGRHLKVPQIGNVIIQDDVEIGANSAVDRATLGSTIVGKGTKIDNMVQVGHNVILGEHNILCGQVGIAGSTKVGNSVTMAGQVGVAGHLTIGNKATLGAQSGVMHDVPDGQTWLYSPAQPDRQVKRMLIAMQRLPELLRRVSELERQLASTEKHKGE
jgi:UDP-3-O-[3-hydroxymyristoyl] glucosamine N-acyltransferase